MKTALLPFLALSVLATPASAAKPISIWTADAAEKRDGHEYRTLITFTWSGAKTFNGRPEWSVAITCEDKDPATGKVGRIDDTGAASVGQGSYGGVGSKVGDFSVDEGSPYAADPTRGRVEMTDRRCATGVAKTVQVLESPVTAENQNRAEAELPVQSVPSPGSRKFDGYTWYHNDSEMLVDEAYGEIRYGRPKAAIAKAVRPGDVLFRGTFHKDGTVEGTAFAFKVGCPPAEYAVKGTYPNPATYANGRMTLKGPGPVRKKGSCEVEKLDPKSGHSKLVLDVAGDR